MTDAGTNARPSLWARFEARLFQPVDIAWLAGFRIFFGVMTCVSMLRFLAYGWIDDFFVKPTFHFKYWGFHWVEPLSRTGMYAVFWALAALSLMVALGLCFRVAAWLFLVGFVYLQLIDVTIYLNHYYLVSLLALLMAVSPANRAWSLDALLWPKLRQTQTSTAWLYLFRFQVAVVYTFAGLAKLHDDWLLHGQPLQIWLGSRTGLALLGPLFTWDWTPLLMSWAGFLFDTSIAFLLMNRRIRPYAYATVIVFHAMTKALFPIGMFPVIMVVSALVFFSPGWPRWWLDKGRALLGRAPRLVNLQPAILVTPNGWRTAAVALGVLFCTYQLVMPLRFLAYGGNVRWHEQGMRFSWRVMVREKNGSVTFLAKNKETGRVWHVSPSKYLNRLQEREMAGQPDLILQMAHHIRDELARDGRGPVEVRVDSQVSLNGRRMTPLIDPTVDLASVEDGIAKAAWILPAPTSPPPKLKALSSL